MLYVLFNIIRNIGLGLFVNGLFLLQFGDNPSEAPIALKVLYYTKILNKEVKVTSLSLGLMGKVFGLNYV